MYTPEYSINEAILIINVIYFNTSSRGQRKTSRLLDVVPTEKGIFIIALRWSIRHSTFVLRTFQDTECSRSPKSRFLCIILYFKEQSRILVAGCASFCVWPSWLRPILPYLKFVRKCSERRTLLSTMLKIYYLGFLFQRDFGVSKIIVYSELVFNYNHTLTRQTRIHFFRAEA